jgi:hypothetical protein
VVVVVFARSVVIGSHTRSFNVSDEARVVSNNFLKKATAQHLNTQDLFVFQIFVI